MARSKTSKKWMEEHVNDPYVKKAQADGYRSRASYKLIEINEKDRLFGPGSVVMDLGSAPGGWSQIVAPVVGENGRVIASDILPMDSIIGVDFIQGDFTDEEKLEHFASLTGIFPIHEIMPQEIQDNLMTRGCPPISEYDPDLKLVWFIPREVKVKKTKNNLMKKKTK